MSQADWMGTVESRARAPPCGTVASRSKGGLVSLARIEIAGSDILKIAEQRFGDYYLTHKKGLFFLHQPIGDTEMQQD